MQDQPNAVPPGGGHVPPHPGHIPPPGAVPPPDYPPTPGVPPQWGAPPPQGAMPPLQPGMPGPMYLSPPTSGMALASMIIGIASFVTIPFLGHILALVLGYLARNEIKASNGRMAGDGYATAGIILGYIGIGLSVLAVVFFIAIIAIAASAVQHFPIPDTPTPVMQHIIAPHL